jgi:hypothetical protein
VSRLRFILWVRDHADRLARGLDVRGLTPVRLSAVLLAWAIALPLAWVLLHPNPEILREHGLGIGMDGHAYWMVWRHKELYGLAPRAVDAYLYAPAFAETMWPLTLLPFSVFCLVWWGAIIGAFLWLLWPLPWWWRIPALTLSGFELQVGNIHAFLAVMAVLGVRKPGAWSLALFTKMTPVLGVLWYVFRREWSQVRRAVLTTSVLGLVSVSISPGLWVQWAEFLVAHRGGVESDGVLGTRSLWLRLVMCAVLLAWGAKKDWAWLLPIVVALSTPLMGLATLGILAGIPRLTAKGGRGISAEGGRIREPNCLAVAPACNDG